MCVFQIANGVSSQKRTAILARARQLFARRPDALAPIEAEARNTPAR